MSAKRVKRRHTHHHPHAVNEKKLLTATFLNLVITIVEIAGGLLSGSLALLSDALHNLSDTFATFIAYLATLIGKREANRKKTYGYKRLEILAALINAVILIVMSVFLIREAWIRLQAPTPINSMIMLVVGMIGLLANLYAVLILRKDAGRSINVKAAYVHLIADSLSSFAVILGSVMIRIYKIDWIDPLITVLISLFIIRSGFLILKQSVDILMQSAPDHLDLNQIKQRVEQEQQVLNIHHLHAWMLTDREVHMEAHVELNNDLKLSEVKQIQAKIEHTLRKEFGIVHLTLQFEFAAKHSASLIQAKHTQ